MTDPSVPQTEAEQYRATDGSPRKKGWCATHDDFAWVYDDGSIGCFYACLVESGGSECEARPDTDGALRDALNREPTTEEVARYGLDGGRGSNFNYLQWRLDLIREIVNGGSEARPDTGGALDVAREWLRTDDGCTCTGCRERRERHRTRLSAQPRDPENGGRA